jgi:hypothetical protein
MKAKTIKKVLKKVHDGWLASIKDKEVRRLAAEHSIITGGAIASMLLGEKPNDFDVYFANQHAARAVADYYLDDVDGVKIYTRGDSRVEIKIAGDGVVKFKQKGVSRDAKEVRFTIGKGTAEYEQRGGDKYGLKFVSSNAITLCNGVQLIMRFTGNPSTIHENFDFVHCMSYWTSKDNELVLNPQALECLLTKELIYNGSNYPLASIIRIRKFLKRGFSITAGQIVKMAMDLNELDLTMPSVLADQLTGVDLTYFMNLIEQLKEKGPLVEKGQLFELIDSLA